MNKILSRSALLGLAVSVFISVLAISGLTTYAAESVRIGALYPISGPLTLLGEESLRGLKVALDEINSKGGILGRSLELVVADAPGPADAVAEAERLIVSHNVPVIVGSYSSTISSAATPVAERNKRVYWEAGAIADNITERGFKYLFRTVARTSKIVDVKMQFINDVLAPSLGQDPRKLRIVVVTESGVAGTSEAEWIRKKYAKEYKIIGFESYEKDSTDLTSLILRLKTQNPDILLVLQYANDSVLFWKQARQYGLNIKAIIALGAGHSLRSFSTSLGDVSDGVFVTDVPQYLLNKKYAPGIDFFIKRYREMFREEMRSGHSLLNYSGAQILFRVMQEAGNFDPEAIRNAARKIDLPLFATANGAGAKYDEAGDNLRPAIHVMQWQKNQLVTVYPTQVAFKKPIMIPLPEWQKR